MITPEERQYLQELQTELKSLEDLLVKCKRNFHMALAETYAKPRITYRDLTQTTGLSHSMIQRAIDRFYVEPVTEPDTWQNELANLTPKQREEELSKLADRKKNIK